MCTINKPIVDGLAEDVDGQADLIYLDMFSDVGREAAGWYTVKVLPTLILLDGNGREVARQTGFIDAGAMREAVAGLE